jgi:hypothetical protein
MGTTLTVTRPLESSSKPRPAVRLDADGDVDGEALIDVGPDALRGCART